MRAWWWMLSGLVVWTVHFFGVYGIASILPGQDAASWLAAALTVLCALALLLLLRRVSAMRGAGDGFDQWQLNITVLGIALSLVAVLWQGLPALI